MSLLKSRTAAQRAASRSNGSKSRGPKTPGGKKIVSLNALKHGERAEPATRPLWQTMVELGEDPGRYRSLLRDVVGSYPPRNRLELRLCEDITRLWLEAERNQRAQEARLVRSFERLEGERQKQQHEMESSYDAPQAEVLETGLRRAPDSPAKFSEVAACLGRLRARVEQRDFSDDTELEALYGPHPTLRGAGILNSFRALAESPPGAEEPGLLASLRLMILEETRDVAEEQRIYYRQHVEISRAMRLECLAPADREYVQLQRQEELLNRQLERKIKLLVSLQKAVGRRKANEETIETVETLKTKDTDATGETGETGEPLGWLEPAASQISNVQISNRAGEAGHSPPEPAPSQISNVQLSNRAGEAGHSPPEPAASQISSVQISNRAGEAGHSPPEPAASQISSVQISNRAGEAGHSPPEPAPSQISSVQISNRAGEAGHSPPEPAPSQISNVQISNRAGEAGSALANVRAIALRHKIGTPRRAPTRRDPSTEDLLRRVQEVYGLSFDAPETSDPNPGG